MADSNFKLENNSGTGNGTIKVTPKSSKPLDNYYEEDFDLKVSGKPLEKIRLKIANVSKDKYVLSILFSPVKILFKASNS